MRFVPDDDSQPAAGEIILVSCYELGHEPLGLVVPAGVLERAGIRPRVIDLAVEPFDDAAFAGARLVAISAPMHTALRLGRRVAERIRTRNPLVHVNFYGLYAGLHRELLLPAVAHSCFGAEYEVPLLRLAQAILQQPAIRACDIAAPADADPALRSPGRKIRLRPSRGAITHRDHYARLALAGARREVGYTQTTWGCKHLCRHCPLPPAYHGSFYALPVDDVLDDIAVLVERGARHITFADPDFLNGPGQALRVARAMSARFHGVTFDYTAKIEHLLRHARVVDELQDLGCVFVVSALESLNDTVLGRLAKGHTRADALTVVRRFRARGLTLRPSLLPFTPWETRASLGELVAAIDGEGLASNIDPVQYAIRLLIPAGSPLAADKTLAPYIGGFDPAIPGHSWRHPDPDMDDLHGRIAGIAEHAAGTGEPVEATFSRIRDLAAPGLAAAGAVLPGPAPRLTEDWFC